jgi:hypothetical protein
MSDTPQFFVPAAAPDNQESVYAEFARRCSVEVPALSARIYSINFAGDGESWCATVGKSLEGVRTKTAKSHGKQIERTTHLSDPAVVLAIFPGSPYQVITNHGIAGNVGSRWANPFLAGQPRSVTRFTIQT